MLQRLIRSKPNVLTIGLVATSLSICGLVVKLSLEFCVLNWFVLKHVLL